MSGLTARVERDPKSQMSPRIPDVIHAGRLESERQRCTRQTRERQSRSCSKEQLRIPKRRKS